MEGRYPGAGGWWWGDVGRCSKAWQRTRRRKWIGVAHGPERRGGTQAGGAKPPLRWRPAKRSARTPAPAATRSARPRRPASRWARKLLRLWPRRVHHEIAAKPETNAP